MTRLLLPCHCPHQQGSPQVTSTTPAYLSSLSGFYPIASILISGLHLYRPICRTAHDLVMHTALYRSARGVTDVLVAWREIWTTASWQPLPHGLLLIRSILIPSLLSLRVNIWVCRVSISGGGKHRLLNGMSHR